MESNKKRVNKKHYLLLNNAGVINATTPKNWARAHQEIFPNSTFSDSKNTPRTKEIEKHLVEHLKFKRVENSEIVVLYPYKEL